MATEPAEPVPAHPSLAGRPISLGGPGVEGPADSSVVGISTLGYPSGEAWPAVALFHETERNRTKPDETERNRAIIVV